MRWLDSLDTTLVSFYNMLPKRAAAPPVENAQSALDTAQGALAQAQDALDNDQAALDTAQDASDTAQEALDTANITLTQAINGTKQWIRQLNSTLNLTIIASEGTLVNMEPLPQKLTALKKAQDEFVRQYNTAQENKKKDNKSNKIYIGR